MKNKLFDYIFWLVGVVLMIFLSIGIGYKNGYNKGAESEMVRRKAMVYRRVAAQVAGSRYDKEHNKTPLEIVRGVFEKYFNIN